VVNRQNHVETDLRIVTSTYQLHSLLGEKLDFPGWHGHNWDAFWDAITGLVEIPEKLTLINWEEFRTRFPRDAEIMNQYFLDMEQQYPEWASKVEYL
jgi:ribonuclease inhibitor